ncbi:MAG: hypothetical protein JXB48_00390, partial [Candidatus Latescibacteria bacterium]|nr:hypothetical protein [Candidatus Latescibacterota bacterium]
YGLFGFLCIILLLLFPVNYSYKYQENHRPALVIGYIVYLIVSFSNPLFFSSSGVLLVSCVLSPEGKRVNCYGILES